MRRATGSWLLTAALAATAATAAIAPLRPLLAADQGHGGGGGHGIDPGTLALQFLNFAVLLFLLIKFGGGALNKALRARHEQIKTDLEEARRVRAAAETRFQAQEKRLANLEQELAAMRAAIKQDAEHEKARAIAAAEERARRIQEETRFQLDQQVKEAQIRFRAEVAQAAARIAEELLRRAVNAGDEQRLVQGFVAELGAARAAADGGKGAARGGRPREEVTS